MCFFWSLFHSSGIFLVISSWSCRQLRGTFKAAGSCWRRRVWATRGSAGCFRLRIWNTSLSTINTALFTATCTRLVNVKLFSTAEGWVQGVKECWLSGAKDTRSTQTQSTYDSWQKWWNHHTWRVVDLTVFIWKIIFIIQEVIFSKMTAGILTRIELTWFKINKVYSSSISFTGIGSFSVWFTAGSFARLSSLKKSLNFLCSVERCLIILEIDLPSTAGIWTVQ